MCVCVGVAATSVQPKFGETTTSYLDESTSPADFGEIWTLSSVRRGLDLPLAGPLSLSAARRAAARASHPPVRSSNPPCSSASAPSRPRTRQP